MYLCSLALAELLVSFTRDFQGQLKTDVSIKKAKKIPYRCAYNYIFRAVIKAPKKNEYPMKMYIHLARPQRIQQKKTR